jgi:UPF0176 protein
MFGAIRCVLYCTGGIRCEKASSYLRAQGFDAVYQLQGGIHRYLEAFPDGGLFKGKNFVFDSRLATAAAVSAPEEAPEVVGRCIDCSAPFDQYSGQVVCTVCRLPVLTCAACKARNASAFPGEYYCARHRELRGLYCTALGNYSGAELERQREGLRAVLQQSAGRSKSRRRTLRRQLDKICGELEARAGAGASEGRRSGEPAAQEGAASNPQTRGGWGFWKS